MKSSFAGLFILFHFNCSICCKPAALILYVYFWQCFGMAWLHFGGVIYAHAMRHWLVCSGERPGANFWAMSHSGCFGHGFLAMLSLFSPLFYNFQWNHVEEGTSHCTNLQKDMFLGKIMIEFAQILCCVSLRNPSVPSKFSKSFSYLKFGTSCQMCIWIFHVLWQQLQL